MSPTGSACCSGRSPPTSTTVAATLGLDMTATSSSSSTKFEMGLPVVVVVVVPIVEAGEGNDTFSEKDTLTWGPPPPPATVVKEGKGVVGATGSLRT